MSGIRVEGGSYYLIATRCDRPWGNGIGITVYSNDNNQLGRIHFGCHPEFEDYDLYQSFDTNELVNIASIRIAEAMESGKFQKEWGAGFALLLRFNRPNDQLPAKPA